MNEDMNRLDSVVEDSDMKIAGESVREDNSDKETMDNYDRLRRNGDIALARRLGASVAGSIIDIHADLGIRFNDEEELLHSKLLVIFSAVAAMETCLPDRILSRTALNVFYDSMKKDAPELYDSMSVSGAVTFYYLEYRKLGQMPADIGGRFAMLCGRENDQRLVDMGGRIFSAGYEQVRAIVEKIDFSL